MKTRKILGLLLAVTAGMVSSDAQAVLVQQVCTVSSVGWREDIKALRTICGGTVLWNREADANPSCTFKTSMDAIKIFQTTANAALLSGKSVQIFRETQAGCGPADPVIREMYLLD